MRSFRFLLAISVLVLFIFGALPFPTAAVASESSYPLEFTDSRDRTIVLDQEPQRIVSLAPSVTETVFALGAGDRLVGRTDFGNYPPAARNVPSVGTLTTPNTETIVSLEPDLVIASNHFTRAALAGLERAGLTVAIIYGGDSFEAVYQGIRDIAGLLNTRPEAEAIISKMRGTVAAVQERVAGVERPRVYYAVGFGQGGDYTAGGNTFVGRLLEMAGGRNIAADLDGWAYSLEKVVAGDPDIVLVSEHYGMPEQLRSAQGYRELRAVQNGRVRPIDNDMIDRPGPRLAQGLRELAAAIHPELFE